MPPKAAFKTSIARQGDTTTLSGFAAVKLKNLKNPRLRRSRPPSPLNLLNQPAFGGPNPLNPGRLCRPFYFRLLITRKSWGVRKGV